MSKKNPSSRPGKRRLAVVTNSDQTNTVSAPIKAEDKIREALRRISDGTAAEIALSAGVGGSTARRVLAAFGKDGTAVRVPGHGPSTPDRWSLAATGDHDSSGNSAVPGAADVGAPEVASPEIAEEPTATVDSQNIPEPDPPTTANRRVPRVIAPAVAGKKPNAT